MGYFGFINEDSSGCDSDNEGCLSPVELAKLGLERPMPLDSNVWGYYTALLAHGEDYAVLGDTVNATICIEMAHQYKKKHQAEFDEFNRQADKSVAISRENSKKDKQVADAKAATEKVAREKRAELEKKLEKLGVTIHEFEAFGRCFSPKLEGNKLYLKGRLADKDSVNAVAIAWARASRAMEDLAELKKIVGIFLNNIKTLF